MASTFKTIEGTFDVLPGAAVAVHRVEAWQEVERGIRAVMHRFAFEEIRTPILEPTALIARGIGQLTDIVSKEMFSFERGRTSYVLRPEMTAPVVRAYLQHHLSQRPGAARLCYLGPCFRAERPQRGRYRQFHQFGAEILGVTDSRADAEIILVMMAIYEELGVTGTDLRINTLGDEHSRPRYRQALQAYLEQFKGDLSPISQERLARNPLRILDSKVANERELLQGAPKLPDYVDKHSRAHYEALKGWLDDANVRYTEDPFLVRGLDYYTRTAFELEHAKIGAQSALAGGGRYDLLASAIGSRHPVPAVGFAAGLERLFLALDAAGVTLPGRQPVDVWVVAMGPDAERQAFSLVQACRRAGLRTGSDWSGRSLKAQMRLANRAAASYVVILGERELSSGQVQIRQMRTGMQTAAPMNTIVTYLQSQQNASAIT